jgi:hypothetical protein
MKNFTMACVGLLFLASVASRAAIAPVEDPDACLSTEQRAQLVQRGKELFFHGGGNTQLALAQTKYREAADAHERALAELRRCEAAAEPGAQRKCVAERTAVAEHEQRVAAARADHAKRNDELAEELTARARRMREDYPSCAMPR